MDTRTYSGIDQKRAADLLALSHDHGAEITGDGRFGTISEYGVRLEYEYDSANEKLTLGIIHKPLLIPSGKVFSEIEKATGLK